MKISHNISVKNLTCIGTTLAGLLLASASLANSVKIEWTGNHHDYQRFDEAKISWVDAKFKCNELGGNLVTITSENEQGFIANKLLPNWCAFSQRNTFKRRVDYG
jgi:hypothetical protein